jgi:hypothetical protein
MFNGSIQEEYSKQIQGNLRHWEVKKTIFF